MNGSASAVLTLVPPTPVITAVGNGNLPLGIFTTTITGSGFISSSTASLNGSPLATTYSNGALTVTGFYGQSGAANITVTNDSLVSNAFPVTLAEWFGVSAASLPKIFPDIANFSASPPLNFLG